jgi:hypothetical protein
MASQHYIFAHKCLPAVAFHDPHRFMMNLGAAHGPLWLSGLWNDMGAKAKPDTVRPPEGLRAWVSQVNATQVVGLVYLPAPWADAEAYFVGVVGNIAPPPQTGLVRPRVFTLERGMDIMNNAPCTFLCEWTQEDAHLNLGPGPAPDAQAFVQAILARCAA